MNTEGRPCRDAASPATICGGGVPAHGACPTHKTGFETRPPLSCSDLRCTDALEHINNLFVVRAARQNLALELVQRVFGEGVGVESFAVGSQLLAGVDVVAQKGKGDAQVFGGFLHGVAFGLVLLTKRVEGGLEEGQLASHHVGGHHRIEAAADAGIGTVLYLYTNAELSEEERTAIQLSHNAIFGEDDLNILRRQWESIASVEAKLYSGLDDEFFKSFEPVNLGAFNEQDLRFERMELLFLPHEIEALTATLKSVQAKAGAKFAGLYVQYDEFAEAFMRFKDGVKIYNTALAFAVMARTAELFCDYLEAKTEMTETDFQAVESQLGAEGYLEKN